MRMSSERPVVLVIDDDLDMLFVTGALLEGAGFHVFTAQNGREAMEQLEDGTVLPGVIVLDLIMPTMSGWDVWDWLQQSHLKDVPVIVWTAAGQTSGSISAARVFDKGTHPSVLVGAVRELVGVAGAPSDLPQTPGQRPEAGPQPSRASSALLVLFVDDHDETRETMSHFLERAGFAVHASGHGAGAVEALLSGLNPDVIVLDLLMPEMDGWSLRNWLRGSRAFARIPVVIYTGADAHGDVGSAPVVVKGGRPDVLVDVIRTTLSLPA